MRAIAIVKSIPWRLQLAFILAGYAAVAVYSAASLYARYLAELRDPIYSSGGMWAWGDEMLAWYIFCLFMVPTFFLLWLVRQYENVYTGYAKAMFWASLTAPLCLGVFLVAAKANLREIADPLLWRNCRAPFAFMIMALSRIMAPRIEVTKRLITRALLIEGGTLAIFILLILNNGR